jgi:hypothetical protein
MQSHDTIRAWQNQRTLGTSLNHNETLVRDRLYGNSLNHNEALVREQGQ